MEEGIGENRQPAASARRRVRGRSVREPSDRPKAAAPSRCSASGDRRRSRSPTPSSDPIAVSRLAETPRGQLRLGRIGHGLGDEVVAVVLEGDPPAVEVQCHGGAAAVALVVEALQAAGATTADRARLGRTPLRTTRSRDDALADLARAPTVPDRGDPAGSGARCSA